jgi:hypothetical protein
VRGVKCDEDIIEEREVVRRPSLVSQSFEMFPRVERRGVRSIHSF